MLHGVEPGPRPDVFLQQFLVWSFLGPLSPAERVLYLPIVNIIKKTLLNIFVVKLLFLNIPPFLSRPPPRARESFRRDLLPNILPPLEPHLCAEGVRGQFRLQDYRDFYDQ